VCITSGWKAVGPHNLGVEGGWWAEPGREAGGANNLELECGWCA
jgi:hypothetical protein